MVFCCFMRATHTITFIIIFKFILPLSCILCGGVAGAILVQAIMLIDVMYVYAIAFTTASSLGGAVLGDEASYSLHFSRSYIDHSIRCSGNYLNLNRLIA